MVNGKTGRGAPIAVIDVGSNTVLLLVMGPGGRVVRESTRTTRLGQGVFRTGRLDPAAVERTREAVLEFAAEARQLGARRVVAVGTEALRRAGDADAFAASLRAGATVDEVRILSGEAEAGFAIEASRRALGADARGLVVVDVGGGSTEVAWTDATGRVRGVSFPLGSVRLTEACVSAHPIPPAELEALRRTVAREVATLAHEPGVHAPKLVVAVAGTATTLAALALHLARYDAERIEGTTLSCADLAGWIERLAALDVAARRALPGMEPGRADVIVAGLVTLEGVLAGLGAERFTISGRGVRHGVALRLLDAGGSVW
jgi:exopolyphosphatase/guanosine-5'-triphosphate,3'-diphosphate pyrophosphatase